MKKEVIFQVFSDESGFPAERYQSIGVVSGEKEICNRLRNELLNVLNEYSIKELKWVELNGHKPKMEVANKFIDIVVNYATKQQIRIDVLYWDIQDSRHAVPGRDDKANLARMYYKVIKHLIKCWKEPDSKWELYPDKGSNLDWNSIIDFLGKTKIVVVSNYTALPLYRKLFVYEKGIFIEINKFEHIDSYDEPLIQLADLFSGMSRFSKEKGDEYFKWCTSEESKKYPKLFVIEDENKIDASKKDLARFTILRKLYDICKKHKMQVSFKTNKYLCTMNPSNPINFWFYTPQKKEDKAPVKGGF